ncbi:MAG: ribose-5-phosphate isomerase [Candidatus Harrisonbacteria bacterium CG10_big_fil_rev_8_21_14_0_10_40_38]|uniref:Ribose-5-phosphate isomerase n=1 Tax=Candidatus Harrisonbacteria bacterium CG10_big_fil_rev_8_21_14_0_10_40_38 TaxID=1974583 RepID=A0A2H0URK5_9BACT|nr:MAG: ribose-5-phosphate isomerase [Candidatus Harrisonbacteria bacterium CG10_big_fil_rev_8_21_14_0_10_40_38]
MTIYLASDHAGYKLKEKIKSHLTEKGINIEDFGPFKEDPDDDYPDFIHKAADALSKNPENKAIILGGSGEGEAMVANRYKGVRAAVFYGSSPEIIKLSREHNDANALSLGARFIDEEEALKSVDLWLNTSFSNEPRHKRRIDKID